MFCHAVCMNTLKNTLENTLESKVETKNKRLLAQNKGSLSKNSHSHISQISWMSVKKIGQVGENIAVRIIKQQGYTIIERNFKRRIGEIDIIAEKNGALVFFEVKTAYLREGEPKSFQWVYLEEKIHPKKQGKIRRVAMLYLAEKRIDSAQTAMSVGTICIAIRRDFEVYSFKIVKDVVV